jgi:LPXTG-motif cell wall-anchored protein
LPLATAGAQLPSTGNNGQELILIAALLSLIGTGALAVARRR